MVRQMVFEFKKPNSRKLKLVKFEQVVEELSFRKLPPNKHDTQDPIKSRPHPSCHLSFSVISSLFYLLDTVTPYLENMEHLPSLNTQRC